MVLSKRYYCITYDNGERECFNDDSFWYSDVRFPPAASAQTQTIKKADFQKQTGIIIKWIILASFFIIFFGWFVIGHIHAKQRLKKGLPLLAYHRVCLPPFPIINHPHSTSSNTTHSSSSPTTNAAAQAPLKTTSPSTKHNKPTSPAEHHQTHNTPSEQTARGLNPRLYTRTPMPRRSTLRRLVRQRQVPASRVLWRCRSMGRHHSRWARSRAVL